jgi:signal transduction histidine kinase
MFQRIRSWFSQLPIDDPVDRRNAIFMQWLLLFEGLRIPLTKTYLVCLHGSYLLSHFYGHAKVGASAAFAIDMGTDLAMTLSAWIGIYLIRSGKFRVAVAQYVATVLCSGALAYAAFGYHATDGNLTLIATLALSGMMLGRRALWMAYAAEAIILVASITPIEGSSASGLPSLVVDLYNHLPLRALLSYLLIAIILDRSIHALQSSLDESNDQRQQLSVEIAERERTHEQLLHAQKMDVVGKLTSGVAHDVNNVFGIILGFSTERDRLVNDGPEDAPLDANLQAVADAMEGIELAARRGTAVCRKLLNFSRNDVTHAEVFDIVSALRDLRPLVRQLLPSPLQLQMLLPEAYLPIRFDRSQFELAIINLVSNARDAMPDGGTCSVTIERHSAHVALSVHDSGIGMSEATKARIFEPFYTTKPIGGGTGLGLSVVYGLVQQAGGQLTFESRLGEGTTALIRLPMVDAVVAAETSNFGLHKEVGALIS